MNIEIQIDTDRELAEGLPAITLWKPGFPNRLVTARCKGPWESDDSFANASQRDVSAIYNTLIRTLGFQAICPEHEWSELSIENARYLVYLHLKQSMAYEIELRSDNDAQTLTSLIVPDQPSTRFFSNCDVIARDGKMLNYLSHGGQLTDHTFEFAIVVVRRDSINLFLICDED